MQYGLSGSSLNMLITRAFHNEAIIACANKGPDVQAVACGGQFLELYIKDNSGKAALTVYTYQKPICIHVTNLDRSTETEYLPKMCRSQI